MALGNMRENGMRSQGVLNRRHLDADQLDAADDCGALRDELSCGCETDAARATGNDDNLVREDPGFTGARNP
jgi:hypothetical protein